MRELSLRVTEHPILEPLPEPHIVSIYLNGKIIEAREGEPIAAALTAAGISAFRNTVRRSEPRGIFCAIGRCTDCVMTVDGIPNVRTCVTPVREGMRIETQLGLGTWGDR